MNDPDLTPEETQPTKSTGPPEGETQPSENSEEEQIQADRPPGEGEPIPSAGPSDEGKPKHLAEAPKDKTPAEPADKPPPKKKKSALKAFFFLLLKLAVVAGLLWAALTYVFGVFRLGGNNMYPALRDGDLCVTYRLEEYHSGDIVAYRFGDKLRFGRIVARVGDRVDGDEQGVLVNGAHPSEEIFYPTQMLDTNLELPVTLGEGEFVVLNDYREDLGDSRTYGVISADALEGKVIFIFRRRGF